MRVIYIMWWRQLIRQWRAKGRLVGALGQPLLFLLAFGFGFGPVFQRAGEGSYLQFIAPGIISMGVIFSAMFSGIELIWDRQFGFIKETLVAPVPRWQIMFGRACGGATVALLQATLVALISLAVGFRVESTAHLLLALVYASLVALMFTALGTAIASVVEDFQAFPLVMNFLVMPLFFLSGALFPLQGVPAALATVARFNPVAYAVDGVRGALTGVWHFGAPLDLAVLVAMTAVLLAVSTALFARVEA
jgi:ABC-2 type transport system permease protein